NLSGAWYLTRAVIPRMKKKQWGRIINVTTSFFTMLRPMFHPYGPAKAALEAMSAGHAGEFAKHGITVNVVVPGGPCDTPMVPAVTNIKRELLIPPRAMVAPTLWLCSKDADDVTGKRYVAAHWDTKKHFSEARAASEEEVAWQQLSGSLVWPGGKPE
ncbi:MAG: SDR family NAD(P)-dependent oxidoreductase, partial [Proteobacteria bacterium]|nr:SDR family NAD(P)-dependent oxidoreductase [Pseudomonadota bacterium]